jgi:hypothetical protein
MTQLNAIGVSNREERWRNQKLVSVMGTTLEQMQQA